MFKKSYSALFLLLMFIEIAQSTPIDVSCASGESSFTLYNVINPRNSATAKLDDLEGSNLFGGLWLWLIESEEGHFSSFYKYKTMNNGILIISLTQDLGRGGCGRGSCYYKIKVKAMFHSPNFPQDPETTFYDCGKVYNDSKY